jgi:hypothetical protein
MPAHSISTLANAKWRAGQIADNATSGACPRDVAREILAGRLTHAPRAALLAGLVVGALCERGHADIAEEITCALVEIMDERARV